MQDARTVTRFMRSTHDNGNTYGINPSKIVLGGHGSGGYVSLAVATLDTAMEMYLLSYISNKRSTICHSSILRKYFWYG